MKYLRPTLLVSALALSSCSEGLTFDYPVDLQMDLAPYYGSNFHAVMDLVGTDGTLGSIPCEGPGDVGDASCQARVPQSGGGSDLVLFCNEESLCDPEPFRFLVDLGLADLEDLASPRFSFIDSVQLRSIELEVHANTNAVDLPTVEVRWGPANSSVSSSDSQVRLLGRVHGLLAMETGEIPVVLEQGAIGELQRYVESGTTEVRFFLATTYDAEPGAAIPEGAIDLTVTFVLRATGSLR